MSSVVEVVSSEEYARMPLEQKANAITYEQRAADIALDEEKEAEERERAKRSPFQKFAQLNLDPNCGKVRRKLIHSNPSAYEIYDFLVEKADGLNAVICSVQVLKEALGLSEATIYRAINALKESKFLSVMKSGSANVYYLNSEFVWKSYGSNHKNAFYHEDVAKLILAKSEQETPTKTRRMNVVSLKEDSQPTGEDSQQPEDDVWEDCLPTEGEPPEE